MRVRSGWWLSLVLLSAVACRPVGVREDAGPFEPGEMTGFAAIVAGPGDEVVHLVHDGAVLRVRAQVGKRGVTAQLITGQLQVRVPVQLARTAPGPGEALARLVLPERPEGTEASLQLGPQKWLLRWAGSPTDAAFEELRALGEQAERTRSSTAAVHGEAIERWLAAARAARVPSEESRALRARARAHLDRGELEPVEALLAASEALDARWPNPEGRIRAGELRRQLHGAAGRGAEAEAEAARVRALAAAHGLDVDAVLRDRAR